MTDPRQHSPQRSSVLSTRRATHSDVDRLVAVLSRAFDDDPVACFMFRNEAVRRRALRRFFSLQLRHMFIDHGEVWTTDDLSGAAMWAPPTMPRPRRRDLLRLATLFPALFLLGSDFREATRLVSKIEQARPRSPHWYLVTLGTDPPRQSQGVGTSLLARVLPRLDEMGMPAYLESAKERNVSYYARHHFEVVGEYQTPKGPHLWFMWRPPRPPLA